MSATDRVACEDVVMFVNAAIASTGQREFHTGADAQGMSLRFLHEYVLVNYRYLYAATLAIGINDANAAAIVVNLLRTAGDATPAQRALEGRLIGRALDRLPPQRVYRAFGALRALGVNNRRTRAIMRDWLTARPDLAFDAVKYRRWFGVAARHAHVRLPDEVGDALFDWRRRARYTTPILESWRRAHYDTRAIFDLPYTVAEGFAGRLGMDRKRFLAEIEPRLTARERLRLRSSSAGVGVDTRVDLARMPLTRLALYALSLPWTERTARRDELTDALRAAARRAAGPHAGTWGRVVAVLDDSYSSSGSSQKRRRPLAIAVATHFLLAELAADHTGLWLTHRGDPLFVRPSGVTAVGARLVDALASRPDRVVIVSDGWENAPAGATAEVVRIWRSTLDPSRRTDIVHLNPVYDSERFDVRALAPGVATVGVRDAEDAPALIELARFGAGAASLADLTGYFAERVEAACATSS